MDMPTQEDFDKLIASNGKFSRNKLFWEQHTTTASREQYPPLFTLKPREHMGLPSAYLIYMDSVSEYDAALILCPSMKAWDDLANSNWFLNGDKLHGHDGLKVWREHMAARDASAMKALLMAKAQDGDTAAMKAVLAESKTKKPVGRKTKKNKPELASVSRIDKFNKNKASN